ncbi:putative amidase [Dichotomopilus funicola]|uniref:Amidase n=1 Tax=Dichotomopilus funicola TaxID=1934379 RepID=A0AAN6UVP9_9PEZI|nr:putative amidase [Dichotomopilus funicola]
MSITKLNVVVDLGGRSYSWTIPTDYDSGPTIAPAVVLSTRSVDWTVDGLESVLSAFDKADDVFQPAFAQGGLLIARLDGAETLTPTLHKSSTRFLEEKSSTLIFVTAQADELPDGPYFVQGRILHRAWRLYPDENLAFTLALAPSWEPLKAGAYSGLYPVAAVPSRLYYPPSTKKPLNGLRITVKDNYHLSGVHTTLGSGSYAQLYGPQTQTSELVKRLCIDYFPPWNPRGDGYQGPSGSSSGACASVASYPWVDVALGTDTTRSIRMPAASYGLWGLRAPHSRFPLEGVMPSVPAFDTLGVLARSPHNLRKIIHSDSASTGDRKLAGESPSKTVVDKNCRRPGKIIVPTDWFPMRNEGQQKMVSQFLEAVEKRLGCNALHLSFEDHWSKTGPEDLKSTPLQEYLGMVSHPPSHSNHPTAPKCMTTDRSKSIYWPNYYDGYHTYDKFRDGFQAKFGHPPYASPFMTRRWGLATNITQEQREQGLAELGVYYTWVRGHILKPDTEYNFVLLPLGRPGANYRDIVPTPGGELSESAYDPVDFATVLGLPQLVIPISQNPYESRVSKRTEYAPIVASLAGPRGSDDDLLQLAIGALGEAHWPLEVLAGKTAFRPGEDNDRHVGPSG